MPLYDFHCWACDATFEGSTPADASAPPCPLCQSSDTERVITGFSGPFTRRPQGGDARRVDAGRRARDEKLKDGLAKRRDERKRDAG